MFTWIFGFDPGRQGGVAIITPQGLRTHPLPMVKVGKRTELDEGALVSLLEGVAEMGAGKHAFVEKVGAMPKQGVVSMFSFGTGWGQIRGILAGLRIPYELVAPQRWQAKILAGQPKGSEEAVAKRLWPEHNWLATPRCRKAHAGMVHAALIAEYGRRQLGVRPPAREDSSVRYGGWDGREGGIDR